MSKPASQQGKEATQESVRARDRKALVSGLACIAIGLVIYFLPVPDGVDARGMHMLGIFVATIVALVLQPLPTAAVAIIGLTASMLTGAMSASKEAFTGLGSSSIWLIVAAFFIATGFVKTGLGHRIALMFLTRLGSSSLGIAYGLAATDLVLAPATPSNTARLGGILFPVITSISDVQGSTPKTDESRLRLGAYLAVTANNVNAVTSAMFLTAMAGGPICVELAAKSGITLDWGQWALGGIVPGIVALLLIPRVVQAVFPPTLKRMPEGKQNAKDQLAEMGPMSAQEKIMGATFLVMLLLWSLGSFFSIPATAVAFLGVSILLATRVLEWKDLSGNKAAWQTLIFFGILVGMAGQLNTLGVIGWMGQTVSAAVGGMSWPMVLVILSALYFVLHYMFASELAQIAALYPLFLSVMVAAGVPPVLAALMLGALSALMGAMTHYASGPAALIYGSGYVKTSEFFKVGIVCGILVLVIWLTVGLGWWKILGIW
ncbi:MAG: anion permease [Atopobiaceae bacterium]|jgi:DASS family divalent anion:Na+ symporter|nr:anion permease [Atopobiaceae bacterium]